MKKHFIFPIFIFSAFILFSCDNFLGGTEIKQDLENEIIINNSPSISVRIISECGDTSPSGDINLKIGQTNSLLFNPFSDYEFIKWQVEDLSAKKVFTDEEISKLVQIENITKRDTKITLRENNPNLKISPVCTPRPKILRQHPSTDGVFRDSRIQVAFDTEMNIYSIYYTEKEKSELLENGYNLLSFTNTDGKEYFYGYTNENNETYYKNISITSNKKSILNCFNPPYFNSDNFLIIPTKNGDQAPAEGTTIVIEIGRGFFYTAQNETQVTLSGSSKFFYSVNSRLDNTAPYIEELTISKNQIKENISSFSNFILGATVDVTDEQNLKDIFLPDNKIKVYSKMKDSDSGPQNIHVNAIRVYDEFYNLLSPENQTITTLKTATIIEDIFCYFGEFDRTQNCFKETQVDLSNLSDGVYRIEVVAEDLNGNTTSNFTYVLKKTQSNAVRASYTGSGNTGTLKWTNLPDIDLDSLLIYFKDAYCDNVYYYSDGLYNKTNIPKERDATRFIELDTEENIEKIKSKDLSLVLSLAIKFSKITITAKDIFGNEENTITIFCYRTPLTPSNFLSKGDIEVQWYGYGEFSPDGYYLYYGTDAENLSNYVEVDSGSYGFNYNNNIQLPEGFTYYFKVVGYFIHPETKEKLMGLDSKIISHNRIAPPAVNVRCNPGIKSASLYWEHPEGSIYGYRIFYSTTPHPTSTYYDHIDLPASYTSWNFTNLEAGKKYYFTVFTTYGEDDTLFYAIRKEQYIEVSCTTLAN